MSDWKKADSLVIWNDNIASPAPLEGADDAIDFKRNKYTLTGFNYSLNFNNPSYSIDLSDSDSGDKVIHNSYNLSLDKRSEIYPRELLNRVYIDVAQNVSENMPDNTGGRVEVNIDKATKYDIELSILLTLASGERLTHTFIIPKNASSGDYFSHVFAWPDTDKAFARLSLVMEISLSRYDASTAEISAGAFSGDYHIDYITNIVYPENYAHIDIKSIREIK